MDTAEPLVITEPGIYALTNEVYHADPVPGWSLSSSGARKLLTDPPARYHYDKLHPPARTHALDFGNAAHEWLLEGEGWLDRWCILPEDYDGRTKAGRVALGEAMYSEKRVLKFEDFQRIKAMRVAIEAHEFAMAAFEGAGRAETSLFWQDAHTGIWCRCRPDFLPASGRIFSDYKTARSVRDDDLRRTIGKYGYHCQSSWYSDGLRALDLCQNPVMLLIFQEKEAPFLVRCVTIGTPSLIAAETLNYRARRTFAACQQSGVWPGSRGDIEEIDIPNWDLLKAEQMGDDEDEERHAA